MSKEKRGTSDDAPRFSLLIVCGNLKNATANSCNATAAVVFKCCTKACRTTNMIDTRMEWQRSKMVRRLKTCCI